MVGKPLRAEKELRDGVLKVSWRMLGAFILLVGIVPTGFRVAVGLEIAPS